MLAIVREQYSTRHIPEEVVRPDGEHLLVFDEGCHILDDFTGYLPSLFSP